jgi:hypothetical protein
MSTRTEDLEEIERAGRRCSVCRSGRGWRHFEVVRVADRDAVVVCGGCHRRLPAEATVEAAPARPAAPARTAGSSQSRAPAQARSPAQARGGTQAPDRAATAASKAPQQPGSPQKSSDGAGEAQGEQRDRLKTALANMNGPFSTAMAARAAGLSDEKALARLQALERRGEIRRIGKRWSVESADNDVAAAMDRLAARTSNLRIVRDKAPVG